MLKTPLQKIENSLLTKHEITFLIKREDLNHPTIQGNKWRKLKYNLEAAEQGGFDTILTFGGAFSNHIYATAAAGKAFGFKTIGIIRGERIEPLNPTLAFAEKSGMFLHFVSRSEYRLKESIGFLEKIKFLFGRFYLLPEGGTNLLAVKGCAEIIDEIDVPIDYLACSLGSGGTLAGLIQGRANQGQIIGFSALKGGGDYLRQSIKQYINSDFDNWIINTDYHFGGFAKHTPELIDFMNTFYQNHQILLDPLYTGKMMFGLFDLIGKGFFPRKSTLVAIHTGGLQGIKGFNQQFGNVLQVFKS